jgi:hypothetical protein
MLDTEAILAAIEKLRREIRADMLAWRQEVAKALAERDEPISDEPLARLRAAVDEGDASGVAEDSSLEGVLAEVRATRAVGWPAFFSAGGPEQTSSSSPSTDPPAISLTTASPRPRLTTRRRPS